MKRTLIISLLVGMMGVMTFSGCERPETIEPNEGQTQQRAEDSVINTTNTDAINNETDPALFLIGEWVVNVSMSEGLFNDNYTDTLVFTTNGIIEKHSVLSGAPYSVLNDTTIRIERPHRNYDVIFTYYPPKGIMFYNFWDNTLAEVIKNIYYEKVN